MGKTGDALSQMGQLGTGQGKNLRRWQKLPRSPMQAKSWYESGECTEGTAEGH